MIRLLVLVGLAGLLHGAARAETAQSPYQITWSFPDDELSAIDVDRGDLSVSRFASAIELVQFLEKMPKAKKVKKAKGEESAPPARELRVEQRDAAGAVRATSRYVLPLADWRRRLGERMVERLEDEFDAHLRMILPRKVAPKEVSPHAPPDLGAPPQ